MIDLLERDSFVQELDIMLTKALAGQGYVALVSGEAGIGKTSLIEHFTRVHQDSIRVLWGACDSLFTPRPLGPLHDIAMELKGELPTLLNSNTDRQAIFSACFAELQHRPSIVVFEDVHWADEATLDLVKFLGRRIQRTTSLFILTYRDDELGAGHPLRLVLGDLPRAATNRLQLLPLSAASVFALASAEGQAEQAHKLYDTTGGNPFFVTEALASKSAGVPSTVRDAVLARAARLSPSARAVLEAAAVIGSRIEPWLLSDILGAGSKNVDECIAGGMLQMQGDYYVFRHELSRQTILESISPQRKLAFHRLVLNALRESPETHNNLARLVDHAEGTKDGNAVLEFAPAAARQASALGAHHQASAHYHTALKYATLLPADRRAELLDGYSQECDVTEQKDEATHAQIEALYIWRELGRREKEGRALRRLSEIAMRSNQKSEVDRYANEAIAVLETIPPSKELAMAYSHKSRIHMVAYQMSQTVHWGRRAMELAEQLGDIETLIHSLVNIGIMEMWHNQRAEGQIKLERSIKLSLDHDYHHHAAQALHNLASGLIALFDFGSCLAYVNEGVDFCARHDLDNWHIGFLSLRARAKFEQGYWAEAELDIRATQEIWGELEMRSNVDLLALRLHVRRGDYISPEAIDKLRKIANLTVFHEIVYPIAEIFAEYAWLQGDLARCRLEAEPMFHIACQLNIPIYIGKLAYWMWRAGAIAEPPANAAEPYAMQISGKWQEAATIWEKYSCPYEQAMALMDGDESAQLAALEIFERLGARPAAEKLKQKMRSQGIRSIPRGPRPSTRENPFGLTARELEVLASLVEGLSNHAIAKKLSLSTRTVEHHITSILQKMDLQSRGEAVALALKGNLVQSK